VAPLMPGGIVKSLEILGANQGMGNHGSKSDSFISVKEQRVDGSSVINKTVRCTLVAGKAGSWDKLSNPRLKITQ